MPERFPNPEEKGNEIDKRELIQKFAQHLAAEDRDNPDVQEMFNKPGILEEATAYMIRMNKLEKGEKITGGRLGPAEHDELRKFQEGVKTIERQMDLRAKGNR